MKYGGKKIEGRNIEILVLPRGEQKIVFKAQAVDITEEFEKLVPVPEPPMVLKPGGIKEKQLSDPDYLKRLDDYGASRTDFLIINSLKVTKELEWETIDFKKPETWKNWQKELIESGFIDVERLHIINLVMKANALDERLLEQARQDFLAGQSLQEK